MKLTEGQKKKLKEHAKHHTAKHIARMRLAMVRGKSFAEAHKNALRLDKKPKKETKKRVGTNPVKPIVKPKIKLKEKPYKE